ncbi:BenE (plasmid) [Peptoclostridium acidaminophilum DSM 3953]|uniref:BenE n=1 Tax=Peptoclostridium acidaminophilum DSM 3953 TaxID=1286171 RepID=W8TP38_PEPAC|nr:putative sulfate/molybdate transporter [Peptoclostridium acidaminophilum]AHM57922.1 BenE [Peptoclostridium acidaminophilum DSM 3953]
MKNKYSLNEWAGALGDLGTFIPFVLGYITIANIEPTGMLFSFGVMMICSGLFYKTPMPIQPMKAIGGAAIAGGAAITPQIIWGAGLFTGVFWLFVGLSGATRHICKIVSKPVIRGIVLGLGMAFMLEGIGRMKSEFLLGLVGLAIAFYLLESRKFPAMFALLILGFAFSLVKNPELLQSDWLKAEMRIPAFALKDMAWGDFVEGAILLGIPQIPLTLGNAIFALTAENNRLFPERPVTEKKISISHGVINLFSPIFGGIPVCHGAGGLLGHTRFGAKTGGALVILGSVTILLAVFFGEAVVGILRMLPPSILGVILFVAGIELAYSARDSGAEKSDFYVVLVTAAFGITNMGAGFLAGVILDQMIKRKIIRL